MSCSVFVLVVCCVLCTSMGLIRLRGLDPETGTSRLENYPMITVVMCCKGTHSQSLSNFKRNLAMEYPGSCEFIFVVEDESDVAVACARQAIAETTFRSENRHTSIVVAGVSFHNAQKIHNMLFGAASASPESEYILFADDDVFFYPGLMEELVDPLIREPDKVLVSTGYEFIAIPPGGDTADYCTMFYRIHNLWSFITTRPVLCWGGCWMAPLWVFRKNFSRLVDCYLDGGYSDDTIVSCLAHEHGYVCAHPYRAIFPSIVDKDTPFVKYWNFINRQFFVSDTYSTEYNKSLVHSLAYLILSTMYLLAIWVSVSPIVGSWAIVAWLTSGDFTWTYTAKAAALCVPMWVMLTQTIQFATNAMASVSNSVRPPEQHVTCNMSKFMIYVGMSIHIFLMPISVMRIFLVPWIEWANVKYWKKDGKIYKVERKDANGNYGVTELASSSIARTLEDPRIRAMINGTYQQQEPGTA